MRITGGVFGGRNLKIPKTDQIRPTQDRVREALFNIIQFEIPGCDFLDLFAGSGAVGLEALSRGARSATFVESNRRHAAVLKENFDGLVIPNTQSFLRSDVSIVIADVYRWLSAYAGAGFSVGFADPPYALGEERGYTSVLETLSKRNVVRPDGLFVAEMTAVQKAEEPPGWVLVRDRTYGKTRICIWRRSLAVVSC